MFRSAVEHQWVEQARPIPDVGDHPALWVTERLNQVSAKPASTTAICASVSNDFTAKTLQAALNRVDAPDPSKE